jgi:hypothetical protein
MSSNPGGEVTTIVIELEPGWVYVKIADPKPAPDRIEFFLRRTIDEWFNARPDFVIERAEAITEGGEMLGINVWYHRASDRDEPSARSQPPPGMFSVEVHGLIARDFSKEYIEAVIDDAMKILPSYQDRQDTLVVINPRQVAVLLNTQAQRGAVIPASLITQAADGPMKAKLEAWLAAPDAPFYVMHLAGNWFA